MQTAAKCTNVRLVLSILLNDKDYESIINYNELMFI